jgi:glutathione S-transferase
MKLHILPPSPNSVKTRLANRLMGGIAEEIMVDVSSGAHKQADFLALNPNGRLPVLELDDGTALWESNAITNRLCAEGDTPLWPKSNQRYDIMRWQFWEACHWTPAIQPFLSYHVFGNKEVDLAAAEVKFREFAAVLDGHLAGRDWLTGDAMTTADLVAAPIMAYAGPCRYPLADFPNITRWFGQIEALEAWAEVNPLAQGG